MDIIWCGLDRCPAGARNAWGITSISGSDVADTCYIHLMELLSHFLALDGVSLIATEDEELAVNHFLAE